MPALSGATEWANGEPAIQAGSPVLVHFWSVSCHLCHENMPHVKEWKTTYGPKGLQVVAVHMPRQEEDTNIVAIRQMVGELGIDESCAIDNQMTIADAFENTFTPAYFLFDQEGNMKGRSAGHHGIKMLQTAFEKVFGED